MIKKFPLFHMCNQKKQKRILFCVNLKLNINLTFEEGIAHGRTIKHLRKFSLMMNFEENL